MMHVSCRFTWTSSYNCGVPAGHIPSAAVGPLVDELAWYIRDDFTVPPSKVKSLMAAQQAARRALYALIEIPYDGEPTEADYF